VSDNKGRARDVLNILLINRPVDAVLGWLELIDKDPRHSLGMKIAQQSVGLSYRSRLFAIGQESSIPGCPNFGGPPAIVKGSMA